MISLSLSLLSPSLTCCVRPVKPGRHQNYALRNASLFLSLSLSRRSPLASLPRLRLSLPHLPLLPLPVPPPTLLPSPSPLKGGGAGGGGKGTEENCNVQTVHMLMADGSSCNASTHAPSCPFSHLHSFLGHPLASVMEPSAVHGSFPPL